MFRGRQMDNQSAIYYLGLSSLIKSVYKMEINHKNVLDLISLY
jgi:hypothetical protein